MTAAAYLLTVVLLGFAAALLRLPPLVGYIAAGFVLGGDRGARAALGQHGR